MGKALKSFAKQRLEENMINYNFFFNQFYRKIVNMFEWKNLPHGISERFIEDKLFYNGHLIFYRDNGIFKVAQNSRIGLNLYEEPTGFRAFSVSGDNKYISRNECVEIWNNKEIRGSVADVNFFCKRLENIEKAIDINLEQLKNPFIIACNENQKNTVREVLKQKTDGVPYIFTSSDFGDMVDIRVFNLDIKNHTKDLQDLLLIEQNRGNTHFGINNVNIVKKERLTSGETDQNNEEIELNKQAMLTTRQDAVKKINEKWGLNIEVRERVNVTKGGINENVEE